MGVLELLLMPSCSESCSESCVWDWVFGLYIGGCVCMGMGVLELLLMSSRFEHYNESWVWDWVCVSLCGCVRACLYMDVCL